MAAGSAVREITWGLWLRCHKFVNYVGFMAHTSRGFENMVQLFLGHADINTTHLYCELDIDMKRKILERSCPQNTTKKSRRWQNPNVLAFLDNLGKGGSTLATPS